MHTFTFSHEPLQVKEETKTPPKSLKESVSAIEMPLLLVGVSLETTCLQSLLLIVAKFVLLTTF